MKNFSIYENGNKFATINARTAGSALRKAAKEYPRKSADYNLEPGQSTTVDWTATDGTTKATAAVSVPGVGVAGCEF